MWWHQLNWIQNCSLRNMPKKIYDLGEEFHDYHFQMAEKYLVKVIEPNIAAKSFDDLRYATYTTRKTLFSQLPPTSSAIKGNLLWAYYFINICFNILDTTKPKLQQVNFGWKLFNGMLIPEQFLCETPKEFLVTCTWRKDLVIVAVVKSKNKCVRNTASVKTAKICDNRIAFRLWKF